MLKLKPRQYDNLDIVDKDYAKTQFSFSSKELTVWSILKYPTMTWYNIKVSKDHEIEKQKTKFYIVFGTYIKSVMWILSKTTTKDTSKSTWKTLKHVP